MSERTRTAGRTATRPEPAPGLCDKLHSSAAIMDARLVPRRRVVPSFHVRAGAGSVDIPHAPRERRGI
jgi:hypothetical protein